MKNLKAIYYLLVCSVIVFSCTQEPESTESKPKNVKKVELPAPFKKHLKIELGPDIIFDILAWGRGSDSSSSLLILRSDSIKNDFTVASSDNLDGYLEEVFNTDLDKDTNPEIIIYLTKNDKYKTAEVLCYEFKGKTVNKITFPDLTSKAKKQYRGNDKFYVKQGELYRDFELFATTDSASKPMGKMALKYFLKGNRFDLTEIDN